VIKVQMAFVGNHEIVIPVSDNAFKGKRYEDLPKPLPGYELSMTQYALVQTPELARFIEDEFNRMKNDIWQNFFDAWLTKSIIT